MAEYIDKEIALSLVQPDTPEDEKAAVTITTAKKLVRSIVYRTPTADVAPVIHAHWIRYPDCGVTKCSNCGWSIEECWDSDYCPHCGAKMDEQEDKHEDYT